MRGKRRKGRQKRGGKTILRSGQGWALLNEDRARWKGTDIDMARVWDRLD